MRRSRLGILSGCDFRRIEQIHMDAESGWRRKHSARTGGGESVAKILVESDAEELDSQRGSRAVIRIGVTYKD